MQAETLGHGPGWLDGGQLPPSRSAACSRRRVANLAVFLLSDAAGPMTGALIDQEQWVMGANR